MKSQVQLIAYVDRLGGGGLAELHALLAPGGVLGGLFGGVHLLPFYTPIDGADAGFDPTDHTRVDPRLGDWDDVARLAGDVDVMADVIVNHISSGSPQFADWSARGAASPHAGMFLTFDAVFPRGASEADLLAIYRPRPGLPLTATTMADGTRRLLWTTFTPQQVDLDVEAAPASAYLDGILRTLAGAGVRMARLDAVGYAIKRAGTPCFMLPQTFDFIDAFTARARALGIEVLVEIHAHHRRQIEIARRVDRVYDFALPPLVLHALHAADAAPLRRWLAIRPTNALTVLDTHDGIGVIDVAAERDAYGTLHPGLLDDAQVDRLVESIHRASGGQSRRATGAAASNLDLYQVNCTYLDALGGDARADLIARAIQFFVPGVPQVYYVGLLGGRNDMALLAATGVGRDINRRRFDRAAIDAACARPSVRDLFALIQLRNHHPAFAGAFDAPPSADGTIELRWHAGVHGAFLHADLAAREMRIEFTPFEGLDAVGAPAADAFDDQPRRLRLRLAAFDVPR